MTTKPVILADKLAQLSDHWKPRTVAHSSTTTTSWS
jgi:hypothetical protein